jgi:hypothetical protein
MKLEAEPHLSSNTSDGDNFGYSAGLSGRYFFIISLLLVKQKTTESHFLFQSFAVVGAYGRDADALPDCGEVYVFELIGESWSFSQSLGSCESHSSFFCQVQILDLVFHHFFFCFSSDHKKGR